MQKRVLLLCLVIVLSLGVVFSLVGNPANGDTWSHQFTFPRRAGLYVHSSQWPLTFQVIHGKRGSIASFGRMEYDW